VRDGNHERGARGCKMSKVRIDGCRLIHGWSRYLSGP
jgi:hypothetical protein